MESGIQSHKQTGAKREGVCYPKVCQYLFTVLLMLIFPGLVPAYGYQTERVVLVIIDGLRYTEGLGDPNHTQVPRMAELAEQGAIVDNFRNDGFTYTSRAIPAIWCGAWTETYTFSDPDCGGENNKYTELPTVFEYYRKQVSRPASDCVYTLKALCPWRASFDSDYGPDYWPRYHSEGEMDLDVWHETEAIIAEESPHFLLMYLADVDHAGHVGIWDDYLATIARADSIVGQLWDVLQADTAYAGKTTMLVTNDHGRHTTDFTGHGDGCEGCRHIQLLAIGPDTPIGLISDVTRTIPDIAPTIGELLAFTTESATGTPMLELLDETLAVETLSRKAYPRLKIYPNPANLGITIALDLTGAEMHHLQIFDLSGHLVRTLEPGGNKTGVSELMWLGRDDLGRELPSATYLLRATTDSGFSLGKVVLLK